MEDKYLSIKFDRSNTLKEEGISKLNSFCTIVWNFVRFQQSNLILYCRSRTFKVSIILTISYKILISFKEKKKI
jgi:hypothetical protein